MRTAEGASSLKTPTSVKLPGSRLWAVLASFEVFEKLKGEGSELVGA